jgi:hypothetical protein
LNTVLKSTHGVAGVSAQSAIDLSKAMQKVTAYSDEQVLSIENMGLTFTGIGKNIFPDATKAAMDMAVALNHGLTPSGDEASETMKLLGKALQDPDAGLGALHRVGVNVDELKKKFVGVSDIATKQKLILAELNTEFGGSAKAAGTTFAGSMSRLKNIFNDVQETIGKTIVNAMTPFIAKAAEFLQKVDWDKVISRSVEAIKVLWKVLSKIFDIIVDVIRVGVEMVEWMKHHKGVVEVLAVAFGALATSMALGAVFDGLKVGFATLRLVTIPSTIASLQTLGTAFLAAFPFAVILAAAVAAFLKIQQMAKETIAVLDHTNAAVDAGYTSDSKAILEARRLRKTGIPANIEKAKKIEKSITSRASGGSIRAGQPYLVGDNPDGTPNKTSELFMPDTGGTIFSARKTQQMLSGNTTHIYGDIHLDSSEAVASFFKRLGQDQLLASRGMTPVRSI